MVVAVPSLVDKAFHPLWSPSTCASPCIYTNLMLLLAHFTPHSIPALVNQSHLSLLLWVSDDGHPSTKLIHTVKVAAMFRVIQPTGGWHVWGWWCTNRQSHIQWHRVISVPISWGYPTSAEVSVGHLPKGQLVGRQVLAGVEVWPGMLTPSAARAQCALLGDRWVGGQWRVGLRIVLACGQRRWQLVLAQEHFFVGRGVVTVDVIAPQVVVWLQFTGASSKAGGWACYFTARTCLIAWYLFNVWQPCARHPVRSVPVIRCTVEGETVSNNLHCENQWPSFGRANKLVSTM